MKNTFGENFLEDFTIVEACDAGRLRSIVESQLQVMHVPDAIFPERKIFAPAEGVSARVMRGAHGRGGSKNGSWKSEDLDRLFLENSIDECVVWAQGHNFDVEIIARCRYSPVVREWLSAYPSWHDMMPTGISSLDGQLSLFGDVDSEYGIVFGSRNIIMEFDRLAGGKVKICDDLNEYLQEKFVDFGGGNIYEFMRRHLPVISECVELP